MVANPPAAPLVLHVIPSTVARGAQREARALVDRLDRPGARRHRLLTLDDGPPGVPVDRSLGLSSDHPGTGFDLRVARRLRTELQALDPAVVVAHGSEPLKYLVVAMLFRRRPLAYYAIGTYSGSRRGPQETMWRQLLRRPELIVAEGEEVRTECIDRFGAAADRVVFIPNGRDADQFRPSDATPATVPHVVFVGALTAGKRPERFVDVVGRLRSGPVAFRATIIGDGPERAALEAPAREAGVELLGARSDVADLLRTADVLVFTSLPSGEGMPGVLIEAGLTGLPVVATDAPGVRSIVESGVTGLVVDGDDRGALAGALADLLARPDHRRSMGRAARDRCAARFGLATVADQWENALLPLLDDG